MDKIPKDFTSIKDTYYALKGLMHDMDNCMQQKFYINFFLNFS